MIATASLPEPTRRCPHCGEMVAPVNRCCCTAPHVVPEDRCLRCGKKHEPFCCGPIFAPPIPDLAEAFADLDPAKVRCGICGGRRDRLVPRWEKRCRCRSGA